MLENFLRRRAFLWAAPPLGELDAFLVTTPVHLRYLCGFSGSSGCLLLTRDDALLLTDGRYAVQSEAEAEGVELHIARAPLPELLAPRLGRAQRIGFESTRLSWAEAEALRTAPGAREWVGVGGVLERLRAVKDASEIAAIERVCRLAGGVMQSLVTSLRPGLSERSLTGRLEGLLREAGSEAFAFEPIVVSGERGALPHGRSSGRLITAGDLVTIDFGAVLEGYHADLTRTVAVGESGEESRRWHGAVARAVEAALALAGPGHRAADLDAAARTAIDEAGLGAYFVHHLGHGLGLEVHEEPRLAPNSEQILVDGMVVTIEPGVYLPGRGGVRIEEDVVITPEGHRVLTKLTRSLDIEAYR
jgi:Xaa-Pro aminopeptidase